MPEAIVTENPRDLDARISSIPPERDPEPAPPLRLTMAPESQDDELRHMRTVISHYIRKHGADCVLLVVQQLAADGAR